MLVSTTRSVAAAAETAGAISLSAGLCCKSIALLRITWRRSSEFRPAILATTSAEQGAGSHGNEPIGAFRERKELMHGSRQKDDNSADAARKVQLRGTCIAAGIEPRRSTLSSRTMRRRCSSSQRAACSTSSRSSRHVVRSEVIGEDRLPSSRRRLVPRRKNAGSQARLDVQSSDASAEADLRRADIRHEAVELGAQAGAFADSVLRRIQHLFRGRAGFGGAAVDLADVGGGGLRALRDGLDAAGDLLRRRALLLDRARNRRRRSTRSGRWSRRSP